MPKYFSSAFFAFAVVLMSTVAAFGADVCNVQVAGPDGEVIGIAAKGFAANVGGRSVLITTGHAMTQLAGAGDARTGFGGRIGVVTLTDMGGHEVGKAGRCLLQNPPGGGYTSDLLVYELTGASGTYSLSSTLPRVGSKVWIVSSEKVSGVVTDATPEAVIVKLDRTLTALHSSGSPVVDDRGNVVGMLVGTGEGRTVISCNPAVAILSKLDPRAVPATAQRTTRGASRQYGFTPGNSQYLNQPAAPASRPGVQTYGAARPGVQTYGAVRPSGRTYGTVRKAR